MFKKQEEKILTNFEYSNVPKGLMSKEDIISWNKAKDELSKIFYSGATKKGKY